MEQSEEKIIKEEQDYVPLYEQIIYLAIFLILSFIGAIFFLKYFIDLKNTSKILFTFCLVYYTLLLFYQMIINFDFVMGFSKDSIDYDKHKFSFLFIEYFYLGFGYYSYFLRYLLFPIYSGYLKSGYLKISKRILDSLFLHFVCYHYIKTIIGLIIIIPGIILFILYFNVLIDLNGKYGLLNYLNFLSLIKIYINVGFFIMHNIIDSRRKFNADLNYKYYEHFKKYVIKKIDNDRDKMEKAYRKLCEEIPKIASKETYNNYYKKLSSLIELAKDNKNIFKINFDDEEDKLLLKYSISEDENDKTEKLIINQNIINDNLFQINNDNNEIPKEKSLKCFYNRERQLSYHVRKFKKYLRKIPKLQFLIDKVSNNWNYITSCQKILLYGKYFIYYLAMIIIIISDYLCLKYRKSEKNKTLNKKLEESVGADTPLEFIGALFLTFLLIFMNSSYSIAVIYSIYKRNIITDDLIYGKHSGDNLNLINTTKEIAGLATVLAYCNLYAINYFYDFGF